jgi:hypothetical protein
VPLPRPPIPTPLVDSPPAATEAKAPVPSIVVVTAPEAPFPDVDADAAAFIIACDSSAVVIAATFSFISLSSTMIS